MIDPPTLPQQKTEIIFCCKLNQKVFTALKCCLDINQNKKWDRIKGLKLWHFGKLNSTCHGKLRRRRVSSTAAIYIAAMAVVHEAPQYKRYFFLPRVLWRLVYCGSHLSAAVHERLFSPSCTAAPLQQGLMHLSLSPFIRSLKKFSNWNRLYIVLNTPLVMSCLSFLDFFGEQITLVKSQCSRL